MKKSLSNQQIAYISRQLAFALNSGISLKAALVFLAGECREKKVALFLQQLGEKISAGQSPGSSILAMNFRLSPLFVEFVLLGEQQGNMALVMEQAAEHFEKQNKLRNMLWTALLYPVLVLSFLLLAIISMLLFVLRMGFCSADGFCPADSPASPLDHGRCNAPAPSGKFSLLSQNRIFHRLV